MSKKSVKVKPGKTQSKIGFVAGLLFVVIGVVVAIPTFGLFGVVWTAFAGLIAFSHFKNAFTDEEYDIQMTCNLKSSYLLIKKYYTFNLPYFL